MVSFCVYVLIVHKKDSLRKTLTIICMHAWERQRFEKVYSTQ